MSGFRENLRSELDFQDIKVKELSDKCGIPKATLECYLRTQAVEPSAENAVKIARVLKVPVEYLVTGGNADRKKQQGGLSQEARELIRWIESLSSEKCKAVLRLVKTFRAYP
jgi:transcriptional regulator with XRE-family HTH domain